MRDTLARIAFALFTALLFYALVLSPSGSPQDNTIIYARSEVSALTEFKLASLKPASQLRIFPDDTPASADSFLQNLKHRRIICLIPGEELLVFEAVASRDLDALLASDVENARAKLAQVNRVKNELSRLQGEVDTKDRALNQLLTKLRMWKGDATPELEELYAKSAGLAEEIAIGQNTLQALDVDAERQAVLYDILRLRLAATMNAASSEREFALISRRDPAALSGQLSKLLSDKIADATERLDIIGKRIDGLRAKQARLMKEAFSFSEPVDAPIMLRLIADGSLKTAPKLYQSPPAFAGFIETELARVADDVRARELAAYFLELESFTNTTTPGGIELHAVDTVQVHLRDFDRPYLSPVQLELIRNHATQWGAQAWGVFVKSLAASFAAKNGKPVAIPPPEGDFSPPVTLRIAGDEVPAFIAAVAALPPGEAGRGKLADALSAVQDGFADAGASSSASQRDDAPFWAFANAYLQEISRRAGE